MIHVKQRFPNFFSGFTPVEKSISTLQELQEIDFVARWINNPKFDKLSLGPGILMAEMNNGSYWAIAFLKGDTASLNLPRWKV